MRQGRYLFFCGTMAGLASLAALAAAARLEGRGALQPVNATSHWLNGDSAAAVTRADLRHTGVGLLTHAASSVFWALPLARWLAERPARSPLHMACESGMLALFAAAFDYGVIPRRLRPGWELVLSRPAVGAAFVALAAGLAGGGLAAQRWHRAAQVRTPSSKLSFKTDG